VSHILKNATERSFVILDELGRGTSTYDGVSIAYATLKYLVDKINPFCIFISHFPSLSVLERTFPKHISNYHMGFTEDGEGGITFLFALRPGLEGRSYGLNVARLANLPQGVLKRASEYSKELQRVIESRTRERCVFQLISKMKTILEKNKIDENTRQELIEIQTIIKLKCE